MSADRVQLHRDAALAATAAGNATTAIAHVRQALSHADHIRGALAGRADLHDAFKALERSIKHFEQARQRLLRKADRLTGESA
ncbi:MAG TPA: hypothetical protein VFH59_17465 [Frateuria sp.]|uniref:hypothetical protein n=1 Tax=Frateuria sp. TaxID=2211372 RepID=UPI002D7F1600|nr:hypothetical protein [Frateuria sp.]HET6807228.1 hypothetical protein [Frateuria sp.]